jgi:hypothetical protein
VKEIVEPEPLDLGPLESPLERGADLPPARPVLLPEQEPYPLVGVGLEHATPEPGLSDTALTADMRSGGERTGA